MKTKQLFTFLAVLAVPAMMTAQWNMVRFDQYNTFTKVAAATTTTAFAIGHEPMQYNCFILRTNDGAQTWDSIWINTASSNYQLTELHFENSTYGFAGGTNNNFQALIKTADNGTTWTDVTPDPSSPDPITAINFVSAQSGFASAGTTLYTTVNGGASWTSTPVPFTVTDLNFTDMLTGTATGTTTSANTPALIMKTTDGGQTWTSSLSVNDPNLFVSIFTRYDKINLATAFSSLRYSNKLYRTIDGGTTWTMFTCDSVYDIVDFDFTSATSGHVLSSLGQIFSTTDAGATWTLEYSAEWGFYGPSIYLLSIAFIDQVGYVVGTSGLIKKYEPAGIHDGQTPASNVTLFPNPLSGSQALTIKAAEFSGECDIQIMNANGQLVFRENVTKAGANGMITLSGLNLSPGAYFVTIRSEEKVGKEKLMIVE